MSTDFQQVFQALAAEFHPSELKTRSQAGRQLTYITARVAMNRLDEVLGGHNWKDEYTETEKGLKCRLWFRVPGTDEWLWKEDGGASAGMSEADNDEKSAYSDAFKRAAVKLGVARYLYGNGVPIYPESGSGAGFVPHQAPAPEPAPEPARPHSPGKNNLHPNKSGFHNGQYANPEDTKKYLDRLKEKVEALNGQWLDFWQDPKTGELPNVPACQKDLMSIYQADGHIVKWLVETGQIDADATEKNGKPAVLGRHAAIILGRGKAAAEAMKAELEGYMARTFEAKKDAIYRKHPDLAPEGWAEEQAEANDRGDAYEEPEPALSNA